MTETDLSFGFHRPGMDPVSGAERQDFIEFIRDACKRRFAQESVPRVDRLVCILF